MNLPEFLRTDDFGEILLQGHRITLYHIMKQYNLGMTPEEIVEYFPTLNLEKVNRVIGFYHANRADVDRYVQETRAELDRQEALYGKRDLREKLRKRFAELYPGQPLPGAEG
jgi:uncharacterized protein (DUF433 family)